MSSQQLQTIVMATKDQFMAVQSDQSITFEKEAGFAIQALSAGDFAMKTALGNKQSVIDAVTNVSAIGVSLNPAKKQAYLVPRDGKICLDISYMGLIDIAVSTGAIKWAQAAVVHELDKFTLRGYDEAPEHDYQPFGNRGKIVGVYCVVKTSDNEYLTHTMSIEDVYDIRNRSSQSFKGGKSSPWKTDEAEMIKKTCVKQAYKYWPKVERLQKAIHHLNTESGEGLAALAPTRNPNKQLNIAEIENIEDLILKLEDAASLGTDSFVTLWRSLKEEEKRAIGIPERDRIKKLADAVVPGKVIEGEASNV
jgi:recombination protein RecT